MMAGMSRTSGKLIDGNDHLAQSIADILSTPIGSRVHRRDYGSMLFELIDQPLTGALRALFYAATALALSRWEPRLKLRQMNLTAGNADGQLFITIEGDRTDLPAANNLVTLSIPIRARGVSTNQV